MGIPILDDVPIVGGLFGGTDPAEEQARRTEAAFGDWRTRWHKIPDDLEDPTTAAGRRYKQRSDLYQGDVNRSAGEATSQLGRIAAGRGISDSGYAVGQQGDVLMRAAQARAKAREMALNQTLGEQMQLGMGDLSGLQGQVGMSNQAAMQRSRQDNDFLDNLLSLGALAFA